VCERLMSDTDLLVHKAVGWAIREAGQQDPAAALDFLRRWKEKAQPRIVRDGSQKLPEEYRADLREE
jgi:3-methyladenine DNA glycosylase AlkD